LNRSGCKFDADGGFGIEIEFVSGESAEEVGFTDARITNQDDCSGLVEDTGGMTAQSSTFEQELYGISKGVQLTERSLTSYSSFAMM